MAFENFVFTGRTASDVLEIRINKSGKACLSRPLVKAMGEGNKFSIMIERSSFTVAIFPNAKGPYKVNSNSQGSIVSAALTAAIREVVGPGNGDRACKPGTVYPVQSSEDAPPRFAFRVRLN